ncbi:MAG: tetratricopeptide repeat protein, partial [Myxococcota bacterium]
MAEVKTTHDRMEEAGLLDGRLDPRTRAAWPAWASEHAATCPDCIALILLDARLSSRFADGGEPPPVPSPEALRSRLAARRAPPPLTMLVARAPAFSPGVYRGGALEITRTERGVRAYDPDATHLVMFGVADGRVELLGDAEALVEGVVAEAELAPDRPVRVVALAARGPLDGELVRLWLADQPEGAPLDVASAGDRVHLTEVDVAPRLAPGLLRLAEGELPPTSAEVTALLGEGREAGSAGHSARAAEAYRRALARSSELGDRTGELKATLGLAMALRDLGYMEDALRLFSSVAARHALNRQLGSMFARAMMNRQLWRRSAAEAERWEAEALRLTPGVTAFAASARAEIALLRGQLEEAHEVLRGVSLDGLKDGPRIFLELFRARALAAIGEPAAARAALGAIRIPDGMAFEMTAIRLCVEVDVSRRAGEPVAWDEVVARVRAGVGDRLQDAEASYLYEVAEGALAAGHADVARALLHLRFAPHDEAPEEARILVASFADSSLGSTPTATGR